MTENKRNRLSANQVQGELREFRGEVTAYMDSKGEGAQGTDCGACEKVGRLERALEKIITLTGHGNMLREFGLKRWEPSADDRRRYK